MKFRTYFVLFLLFSTMVSNFAKNADSFGFSTGVLVPFNNNNDKSSMVLGATYHFWGIFDFMGSTYFGLNSNAEEFYEVIQAPDLYSFGVGVSIPMGGFYFKSDSQQFIKFNSGSFSDYFGSYKGGIGLKLDKHVEIEFYYRHLYDYDKIFNYDETSSFIGLGLIFKD